MKKTIFWISGILLVLGLAITAFAYQKSEQNKQCVKSLQNDNNIKVSVVVPVYKAENFLCACLDSIRNQTLKDIEIICIDDGSPDNSGKILDEYAEIDPRFRVYHQINAGVSATRNRGMALSRGEYIKFVDSDDTIDPTTCEKCYNKAKNEDADIVYHNSSDQTFTDPQYLLLSTGSVCFGAYRTKFLKDNNIRFKEGTSYGEDQAFKLICNPKANKIVCFSENLYNYVSNPNSLCHTTNTEKHSKSHAKNVNYVYEDWKKNGYFDNDVAKVNFLEWASVMNYWQDNRDIDKMFLESIGQELLKDEVLNLLPKDYKASFVKMKNKIK